MANGKNITEILILNLLDSRPMYGAEMIEEIKKLSGNTVIMSLPALYSSLHRMADKRLVNSYQKQSTIGGRCRVYNITKYGREYLEDHPIEINYNVTNNAAETINITNNIATANVNFSTLQNSVSLPLNKTSESTITVEPQTVIEEPVELKPLPIPAIEPIAEESKKDLEVLNNTQASEEKEEAKTESKQAITESVPEPKPEKKPMIQTSAYISPTDKIITTPEPKYQQTLIGLSGTVGGSDLRPLVKLNKVKVGNDYVIINRLRVIAALINTAIFMLVNFFCSLTKVVQNEYYNIVYIALAIYALINLAIYFVYPRIKAVFKPKKSGIKHLIIALGFFIFVLAYCLISQSTKLLWLLLFTFAPIIEFILIAKLRNRSCFQC